MKTRHSSQGFTLIELAIVLFIAGLILAGALGPLATQIEQRERQSTQEILVEIRENLIGYALANGHLPCPDCPDNTIGSCGTVETALGADKINDGIEDGTDDPVSTASNDRSATPFEQCATEVGNLPWATLGVAENDAWGAHFIYRVTEDFADNIDGTGSCTNTTLNVSFCLDSGNDADIDVEDANGNAVAQDLPVVVVSIGRNSDEAFADLSAEEKENQDNYNGSPADTTFVSADYSRQAGSEFDDILIWVSPSVLMYQMVSAKILP
jgi:prepilin-type N-terminal cleavage/methylation domain-containing protein